MPKSSTNNGSKPSSNNRPNSSANKQPPSTPRSNTKAQHQSTPQSHGLGARVSDVSSSATFYVEELKSIAEKDLENCAHISPGEFLKKAFPTVTSDAVDRISAEPTTGTLLKAYKRCITERRHEKELYSPFANLANHMMMLAHDFKLVPPDALPVAFVVNDPRRIKCISTEGRSPDVILVRKADKDKPEFAWKDVISVFEFKAKTFPDKRKRSGGSNGANKKTRSNHSQCTARSGTVLKDEVHNEGGENETIDATIDEIEGLKTNKDPRIQCVGYAAEQLSCWGNFQIHVINAIVDNSFVHLWLYDRVGAIEVLSFDLVDDFSRFATLIVGIAGYRLNDWGIYHSLNAPTQPPLPEPLTQPPSESSVQSSPGPPPPPASSDHNPPNPLCPPILSSLPIPNASSCKLSPGKDDNHVVFPCGTTIKLGRIVSHHYGVKGRGTRVMEATVVIDKTGKDLLNRAIVVKMSWIHESRQYEARIITLARDWAKWEVENPALMARNLSRNYGEGDDPRDMRDHLPEVFLSAVFGSTRQSLRTSLEGLQPDDSEHRELRIIVMEKLNPLKDLLFVDLKSLPPSINPKLDNEEEFLKVLQDITKCILWLSEIPQILHRDISLNNVMYRRSGNKFSGVLNDFDLAAAVNPAMNRHCERTGTLPFMSIGLLQNKASVHTLSDDLESFFWVLAWVCSRFPESERTQGISSSWTVLPDSALAAQKIHFLSHAYPSHTPSFLFAQALMATLCSLFHHVMIEKQRVVAHRNKDPARAESFAASNPAALKRKLALASIPPQTILDLEEFMFHVYFDNSPKDNVIAPPSTSEANDSGKLDNKPKNDIFS